jgi:hypothetical protein
MHSEIASKWVGARNKKVAPMRLLAAALGVLLTAAVPAVSQTAPSVRELGPPGGNRPLPGARRRRVDPNWPPKGKTPMTPDGKPDLSGAWNPNAFPENVNLPNALKRQGVEIPFQPWAKELYEKRRANQSADDPEGHCLPPGVPRMNTTPYPFRIVQTPKLIIIVYEGGAHIWRQIFMDGRSHPADPNPTWLGDSIGHWEGDTLVVDTVGFNGLTWLDESGLPSTESLHVIERFSRPDLGHLEIVNIVDDPKAYTKPWSFTTHPVMQKGDLMEYICQENNRDVEHLVGK